jgi:hypothetical protein
MADLPFWDWGCYFAQRGIETVGKKTPNLKWLWLPPVFSNMIEANRLTCQPNFFQPKRGFGKSA